jgi:CheY-like chemotaxis protein
MERQLSKTVLLVEDDENLSEMMTLALPLVIPSVHTVVIRNGLEALAWIQKHQPDLILLDYLLPGMNGLELYDRLQKEDDWAAIPLIMMSANLSQKAREERQMLFLPKPFELNDFLSLVESQLAPRIVLEYVTAL